MRQCEGIYDTVWLEGLGFMRIVEGQSDHCDLVVASFYSGVETTRPEKGTCPDFRFPKNDFFRNQTGKLGWIYDIPMAWFARLRVGTLVAINMRLAIWKMKFQEK